MEHFQAALDPRKQELLEARFLGAKVSAGAVLVESQRVTEFKPARVRMSRWHCTLAEVALPLHPTPLVLENWVKQHTALPHRKRGFGQSCASTNAGQRCD
ncbi:unnamed protein product [Pieris macdunnoughi]|uniref:Uncharacterized protein n=1 Tax=Pieris macdunnoughi TaxID=345717 RepID=A0A821X7W7_9NEOP|nr:unnamed protein product [Pieris macdunnoughi]